MTDRAPIAPPLTRSPAMTELDPVKVLDRLIAAAKLLYANAEGCAVNHHGEDFSVHGLPGWLADCAADISAAQSLGARAMQAARAGMSGKALNVDALAQEIRRVDGQNKLGAGALAETLMPFLGAHAMQAAVAGVRDDYAAICKELGCVEKPGVPLRFIQEMRKSLSAARERIDWLLRSWDDATITERQELDRMRRGWGPTTPTERMLRHRDLRDCMKVLSGALTDLTTPEDDNADPEVEARLQEAYDRVNKRYLASLEILRRLDEPLERPDLSPAVPQEDIAARHDAVANSWLSDPVIKAAVHGSIPAPAADVAGLVELMRAFEEGVHDADSWTETLPLLQEARSTIEALQAEVETRNRQCSAAIQSNAANYARATAAEAEAAALRAEVDAWRSRESETQEALQKIGEEFGVYGGEPRTDGGRRVLTKMRDGLDAIANAYTAHGYSDAMDAVQSLKDIAKEALK